MTGTNELHPLAPTPIATPPVDVHPGLGPVILPAAPVASPAPSGARGLLRRAVERVTRFETDRQRASDAQRDAAVAHELGQTRLAIRTLMAAQTEDTGRLGRDVAAFTDAVAGAVRHVEALQQSHDRVNDEQKAADVAIAERLSRDIDQLRADVARVEARLAELTHVMEQWRG